MDPGPQGKAESRKCNWYSQRAYRCPHPAQEVGHLSPAGLGKGDTEVQGTPRPWEYPSTQAQEGTVPHLPPRWGFVAMTNGVMGV